MEEEGRWEGRGQMPAVPGRRATGPWLSGFTVGKGGFVEPQPQQKQELGEAE